MELDSLIIVLLSLGFVVGFICGKILGMTHYKEDKL